MPHLCLPLLLLKLELLLYSHLGTPRGCRLTVSTIYSHEDLIAGWCRFQNGWKRKTTVNFCLAAHLDVAFQWESKITNKTDSAGKHHQITLANKQKTLANKCHIYVSCTDPYPSIVLSRDFTVMRSQNGLDISQDQAKAPMT